MLANLLSAATSDAANESSKIITRVGIGEASLDALIGLIVVFLGIAFLIFVVWGAGKITAAFAEKLSAKMATLAAQEAELPPSISAAESTAEDGVSEETVAVITAALTAYYQTNAPACEFTVKRIKRI